jgi:hypothetical protein
LHLAFAARSSCKTDLAAALRGCLVFGSGDTSGWRRKSSMIIICKDQNTEQYFYMNLGFPGPRRTTRVEVFRQAADELLAATELEGEQPPQPTLTSSEHFEAWEKWYAGRVNMDTIRAIMKDYQVPVKATATKAIRIVKLIKFFIAHT